MTRTLLLLLILLSINLSQVIGQPQPCEEPPMMTSFCEDACIICDIDGFTGRHEATIVGQHPPGFAGECTFVAHNMQWIAFIAGSEDLSVELSVSNCQLGNGLEFGLYESTDCQNFTRISNCFGGAAGIIFPGTSGTITNTEPLVIGQYYYIVMDGGLGDNCDWTFDVTNGRTAVSPLTTSGSIIGPSSVCPNVPTLFSNTSPEEGGTLFSWTLDGTAIGDINIDSVEIAFPDVGTYNLCVKLANACDEAEPVCREITVNVVPPTAIMATVCEGECLEIADTILCNTGVYNFNLLTSQGCDSLVTVDLLELVTPMSNLDIFICEGDTIFIGNSPFSVTGSYQEILQTSQACDSVVNLSLDVVICEIESNEMVTPVVCYGESTGSIVFEVINGTPPFNYSWERLDGAFMGSGNISSLNDPISINGLPIGTFLITIEDNFMNFDVIIAEMTQPDPLALDFTASEYNGFNISCFGNIDGEIEVFSSGGRAGYQYSWSNGSQQSLITGLAIGTYEITVIDVVGCSVEGDYTLDQPTEIIVQAEFIDPVCDGPNTGLINVLMTEGGAGDYLYSLDGNEFTPDLSFDSIAEGSYTLEVMDGNNCMGTTTGSLTAPEIPVVDLGSDLEVRLGDDLRLSAITNGAALQTISWLAPEPLSCDTCLTVSLLPLNSGMYSIEVTSIDDCTTSDSINVEVIKLREFYVPNAFSPNFDGINDYFKVYGGPEVAQVNSMKVFDRWGGIMFEGSNLNPAVENEGWDGRSNGEELDPGVYIWIMEIQFIDGFTSTHSGDITVFR